MPLRPLLWALCDLLWPTPATFHDAIISPQTVYGAKPPPSPASVPPAAAPSKKNTLCLGLKDTVLETETQCLLDPKTVSPDFLPRSQKSGASSQNPRIPSPCPCALCRSHPRPVALNAARRRIHLACLPASRKKQHCCTIQTTLLHGPNNTVVGTKQQCCLVPTTVSPDS